MRLIKSNKYVWYSLHKNSALQIIRDANCESNTALGIKIPKFIQQSRSHYK